jgi:outer membrane protein TolC
MDKRYVRWVVLGLMVAWPGLLVAGGTELSLDEAVSTALASNPGVGAAAERVETARAMIRQATSAFWPRVGVSASYTRTDNAPQAFMMELNQRRLNMMDPGWNPNEPDDTDNVRLSVGLQYRLFDGRRGLQRAMAQTGQRAAAEQLDAVRNELIYQVASGYYGLLRAQAYVGVQRESVASLEENLRVAQERYDAGSVVKTDVLNLEVKLAQAREDLIRAENHVALAVAALNTAIGRDLVGKDGLSVDERTKAPGLPDLAISGFEQRPEYRAMMQHVRRHEQALVQAKREYVPKVNAFGSYDWDSEDLSDMEDSYMVGVAAEWEVFSGFQRPGQIAEAQAALRAARHDAERVEDELRLDLQQAVLTASEAYARMDVSRQSVRSAEEALRITSEQYRQGAADITVLLTAEVGLTATRTRDVDAYYEYLTALANIDRARGDLVRQYVDAKNSLQD